MYSLIIRSKYALDGAVLCRREADMAETSYTPMCLLNDKQASGLVAAGVRSLLRKPLTPAEPMPLSIRRNEDFLTDAMPWRLMAGDEEIGRFKDETIAWLAADEGVPFAEAGEPNYQRRALEDAEYALAQRENELNLATVLRDKAAIRVDTLRQEIEQGDPSPSP